MRKALQKVPSTICEKTHALRIFISDHTLQRPEDTDRQLMINIIPLLQYGAEVGLSTKKQNYTDLEMEAKRMKQSFGLT